MIRKLFYAIILIFAVIFIFNHLEELRLIWEIFRQGDWRWMLAAVGAQFIWLVIIGAAFQSTYRLVGVRERLARLVPLAAAANFVNVVAPSYGLGALAVLIADGRQRGKPAAKVSTATILFMVYDYLGFMIVLPVGLVILYRHGVFNTGLIAASAFTLSVGTALIILTVLGIHSAKKLGKALIWLSVLANRALRPFLQRDLIPPTKAQYFAEDISEGLLHLRRSPWGMLLPGILALMRKAAMMLILYLVSWAFKHPFSLETLIAGFTTSYLFTIASVTPSGVGFVEGAMIVYISAMQVPIETTAAISIAYRGITFWLTLAYGPLAMRYIGYTPQNMRKAVAIPANPDLDEAAPPSTRIPDGTSSDTMRKALSSQQEESNGNDPPSTA